MLKQLNHLIFVPFLCTLLFACGGGGGGGAPVADDGPGGGGNDAATGDDDSGSVVDDIAPIISTRSPADGATGIEPTVVLSATFNEDMLAITLDASSFIFSDSDGARSGVVNFDVLTNVATFTPEKQLAFMRTYTASLSGTITDLSGNTLLPQSWTFTTRDGVWSTAGPVDTEDLGDADYPKIKVDNNGNAVVVWRQNNGALNNIWANRYTPGSGQGSGWGEAEQIGTSPGNGAEISMNAEGDAIITWRSYIYQSGAFNATRHINRYTSGAGWGIEELIYTDNTNSARGSQIEMNNSERAAVVWQQSDGAVYNIHASIFE